MTDGLLSSAKHQVLLGVTGSGKTFTVANVIRNVDKPTLVISHNKTPSNTSSHGEKLETPASKVMLAEFTS
jgi:excinuclease UvrABC helicase subunit UvrB